MARIVIKHIALATLAVPIAGADDAADRRTFRLTYAATIDELAPGTKACVWVPLAPSNAAGPVNYLVYPYVEIDGRPYEKQSRRFSFVALW